MPYMGKVPRVRHSADAAEAGRAGGALRVTPL
jgi:hypothetical protein